MKKEPKIGDYRLIRRWDFDRADYEYTLEIYNHPYVSVFSNNVDTKQPPVWKYVANSPDVEWANRTAKHFNLTIEDEEEN
jgi:hypothetical protein